MLSRGAQKEVQLEDVRLPPVVVEAFTIPETAIALGRSELCVKQWIANGLLPPPILKDTTRSYRHYSVGELTVVAEELRRHEDEFAYLTSAHTATIEAIWQAVRAYRATQV